MLNDLLLLVQKEWWYNYLSCLKEEELRELLTKMIAQVSLTQKRQCIFESWTTLSPLLFRPATSLTSSSFTRPINFLDSTGTLVKAISLSNELRGAEPSEPHLEFPGGATENLLLVVRTLEISEVSDSTEMSAFLRFTTD
uniref:Uncharacterized protein n=1 Tax=Glossina pallidipes TaxID=7398 RepID=A0A1A9ZG91_GLOPL